MYSYHIIYISLKIVNIYIIYINSVYYFSPDKSSVNYYCYYIVKYNKGFMHYYVFII